MVRLYAIALVVVLVLLVGCSDPSQSVKLPLSDKISSEAIESTKESTKPTEPSQLVPSSKKSDTTAGDFSEGSSIDSVSDQNVTKGDSTAEDDPDAETDQPDVVDQEAKVSGLSTTPVDNQEIDLDPVYTELDDAPAMSVGTVSEVNNTLMPPISLAVKNTPTDSSYTSPNALSDSNSGDTASAGAASVLSGRSDNVAPLVPDSDTGDSMDDQPEKKGAVEVTFHQEVDSESGSSTAIKQASFQIEKEQELGRNPSVTAHLRSYFLYHDGDQVDIKEALATGGWVNWQSGFFADKFQLSATAFTSQKLYAPSDKDGTDLLQENQKGFSGISEIYADIKIADMKFRLGRFEITSPYMNRFDSRMVPQSFEGAKVNFKMDDWNVDVGQISKIKVKSSSDFENLYEIAGLSKNRNMTVLSALREFNDKTIIGYYYYFAPDYMYTFYTEVSHKFLIKDQTFDVSAQYTNQRSIGEKLGGDFQVNHYGIRASWERENHNSYLAYTSYSDDDVIQSPWGVIPGYTSMMIRKFNRIGENAVMLGTSFRMTRLNLPNVTLRWNLLYGRTPNTGIHASPDQYEVDMTADYRFKSKILKGLWLRARYARLHETNSVDWIDGEDFSQLRVILNYEYKW